MWSWSKRSVGKTPPQKRQVEAGPEERHPDREPLGVGRELIQVAAFDVQTAFPAIVNSDHGDVIGPDAAVGFDVEKADPVHELGRRPPVVPRREGAGEETGVAPRQRLDRRVEGGQQQRPLRRGQREGR
jgi:hypothetical protein